MKQQSIYKMSIFNLLLLFVMSISNTVKSQRVSHNENTNEYYSKKINFPAKTNEDEVNFKYLNNALSASFISKIDSNHIEDESKVQLTSASNHRDCSISNSIRDEITTRRPLGLNTNKNVVNAVDNGNSFKKRVTDVLYEASSEETNERSTKSSSSNKKTDNQANRRIPPPSVIASLSNKSALRVCEIKYAEYIQRIFPQESDTASDANDAEFNGRVLAAPGEYPHMTAIGFRSYDGRADYKCGGSLISENFVITAAHCTNITGLQPFKVRIGDLNLMIEESYLEPQLRSIRNIHVHPDYKASSYYNDIAILELEKEVHLTEFVRPIRLWTKETLPFTTAYAMGYGSTGFAKQRTNRLTNLNMTIVPNDECNREMPKFPETEMGILSSQICARDYALNRDTCQGDSGGPLQLNIRGRRRQNRLHYHLIGITSYGIYCRSGYPSIYTRVWSYLDWIERIAWKDYFE